jgi:hypothetical protein
MLLKKGEKVHVIARRFFEGDLRRHFVGEVKVATDTIARIEGYVFVFDTRKNEYIRKPAMRERIVSLVDSNNIVNIIPQSVNIEELSYQTSVDNRTVVTDGKSFSLDINEFSSMR